MKIRRSVKINIDYANKGKLDKIDSVLDESIRVINLYIDALWNQHNVFDEDYVRFKVETWLSARMQQCLGKQALDIIKSQKHKHMPIKPTYKFPCINLDSRFIDIQYDNNNSFDIWIRLTSLGNSIQLNIPSKKHKVFKKYVGWKQLDYIRLMKIENKYYVEFIYENHTKTEDIEEQETTKKINIQIGYDTLIKTDQNENYKSNLNQIYQKICNKKNGSKNFKKALRHKKNEQNRLINKFMNDNPDCNIGVSELKLVKHNHTSMPKVETHIYNGVLRKIKSVADERGIKIVKVSQNDSSQQHRCGSAIDFMNKVSIVDADSLESDELFTDIASCN